MKQTPAELDKAALRDLLVDAETAEQQADNGPFYPERGITRESLLAYAARCRRELDQFAAGGAHAYVLNCP